MKKTIVSERDKELIREVKRRMALEEIERRKQGYGK